MSDCTLMTCIRVLTIMVSMILTKFDDDDDDDEICDDEDDEEANDEDISRVVICTLYEGFDLIQGRAAA